MIPLLLMFGLLSCLIRPAAKRIECSGFDMARIMAGQPDTYLKGAGCAVPGGQACRARRPAAESIQPILGCVRNETLDQKIDEKSYLDREMSRRWIDRVKRQRWRVIILEQRPQRSLFEGISCDEPRDQGDAARLDRRVAQHFRIVGAQRPFRLDPVLAILAGE